VVVEENHGFSDIIGNHAAPFINSLAAKGALFTNFFAVAHPSQPNYLALFSGSTQGVRNNGSYSLSAPTLAGALRNAGYSFIGYAESGSPRKHNPWESFADSQHLGQDFRNFETDFSKLPTVSFVIPNLDHDMHDGSIGQADRWLRGASRRLCRLRMPRGPRRKRRPLRGACVLSASLIKAKATAMIWF
jgi:phosphatidylinositol-3-phosphatase